MNDLQMARGAVEGGYNLAIGEPVVLQKYLRLPDVALAGPFLYPSMQGDEGLLAELRHLHPEGEIVVANGAKQALLAAFYALQKVEGRSSVFHAAPSWPSYPTLAKLLGMQHGFFSDPDALAKFRFKIVCATAPNNPDGSEALVGPAHLVDMDGTVRENYDCDVWDAVYAHWVYGWRGTPPRHRIRVSSASKLLGLTGVRVGWLVTEDAKLAAAARAYVEITTSGVSLPAQRIVAQALKWMRVADPWAQLQHARDEMMDNGASFNRQLLSHVAEAHGAPTEGRGMFAWFHPKDPAAFQAALDAAKVLLVPGASCGGKPGWYRMNMAHDNDYTEAALRAIKEHL